MIWWGVLLETERRRPQRPAYGAKIRVLRKAFGQLSVCVKRV